jgi:FkbM family methyltransferase
MKGIINIESITRRTLKFFGLYYKWLFYKEQHAPTKQMLQMRSLYGNFIAPGDLCFDIGANMGSRVGSFLMLGAKVIALEPQKSCCAELKNVYANQPVEIIQKGVGAKNEIKKFYVSNNSLISSFNLEWIEEIKKKHTKNNWNQIEEVEIVTIDSLIEMYGMPKFIKIDTEGFELEVLKGLTNKVDSLSFEYTMPDNQQKTLACLKTIDQLYQGKALYNICKDEEFNMHFTNWVEIGELEKIIVNPDLFNQAHFGPYGDIYIKRVH